MMMKSYYPEEDIEDVEDDFEYDEDELLVFEEEDGAENPIIDNGMDNVNVNVVPGVEHNPRDEGEIPGVHLW